MHYWAIVHAYVVHFGTITVVIITIITINNVYVVVKWSYVKGERGGA